MARPKALCLEALFDVPEGARYRACTARVGTGEGLALGPAAEVFWLEAGGVCELVVTGDDRLAALRMPGAPRIEVERAGRLTEVPEKSPTILLDQDVIAVGPRRFRVHLHGDAEAESAPVPVTAVAPRAPQAPMRPPLEIRQHPPAMPARRSPTPDDPALVPVPEEPAAPVGTAPEPERKWWQFWK